MRNYDPSLSVTQDSDFRRKVIFTVSDLFEERGAAIFDETHLPHGKDMTLFAYLYEIATNPNKEEVEIFSAGALLLGNFQQGVGRKPLKPRSNSFGINELDTLQDSPHILDQIKEGEKFFELNQRATVDRNNIRERVARAQYFNSHIQPARVRLCRAVWKRLRGWIFLGGMTLVIVISLPTLILPKEMRKSLLAKFPTKWLNALAESIDYEIATEWPHARDML